MLRDIDSVWFEKLLVVFSICIMDDLHFRYNYVVNQRKKFIMNEGQIISATSETPSWIVVHVLWFE